MKGIENAGGSKTRHRIKREFDESQRLVGSWSPNLGRVVANVVIINK